MVDFDKGAGDKGAGDPPSGQAPPPRFGPPPGHPTYGPPPGYLTYGPPPGHPGFYGPSGPPHQMPPSNIGWAIGALLLFWPLAIPAFIFSSRVEGYWFAGNAFGAHKASQDARLYGLIGVVVGAVLWVISVVIILVVFVFVASTVHEINHLPTFAPPSTFPS